MKAVSVYSGVELMGLAAIAAGFDVVALCEPDKFCRTVLTKRFPEATLYEYDTEVTGARLAEDGITGIDLVFGGPPCQPASAAGKRLGESDPRWRWPEYLRIVRELRPKWVVAENPTGILSLFGGSAFHDIVQEMSALGYRVGWGVYGADAVEAAHRRDRVFIVGYLADASRS